MNQNSSQEPSANWQSITFDIANEKSEEQTFVIEPLGDEFIMPPGTTFQIYASYPNNAQWIPKIVYYEDQMIVFHLHAFGDGYFFELKSNGVRIRTSDDYNV